MLDFPHPVLRLQNLERVVERLAHRLDGQPNTS